MQKNEYLEQRVCDSAKGNMNFFSKAADLDTSSEGKDSEVLSGEEVGFQSCEDLVVGLQDIPTIGEVDEDYIDSGVMTDSLKAAQALSAPIEIEKLKKFRKDKTKELGADNTFWEESGLNCSIQNGVEKPSGETYAPYILGMYNGNKLFQNFLNPSDKLCGLDGNSNYLSPSILYRLSRHGNVLLYAMMETSFQLGKDIYKSIVGEDYTPPHSSRPSIYYFEACLNFKTNQRSNSDMRLLISEFSKHHRLIGTSLDGERVMGAKFELQAGVYLVIYYKTLDLLRLEFKVTKDGMRHYRSRNFMDYRDFITVLLNEAKKIFKQRLLTNNELNVALSAIEAEKELRSQVNDKHYLKLIRSLTEGNGYFKTS